MTIAIIRLTSACGDAPGYIREGLESLREFGQLVENSDLYRARAESHDCYEAIALLRTQLDSHALPAKLRTVERRYSVDHSGIQTLEFAVIRIAPDGETVGTLAAALPARVSGNVVRVEGTAKRTMPPALDYDAPGGAGSSYDELRPLSSFSQKMFSAAADAIRLKPGMKILDVGCGTGRFSTLFAQRGAVVTGMDRSTTMLTAARASIPAGLSAIPHYIQADANHGLPKENFDAAVFFMSIQYISLSDVFFESLREALAPDGMVAVVTLPHRHFIENEFLTGTSLRFRASISRGFRVSRNSNACFRNVASPTSAPVTSSMIARAAELRSSATSNASMSLPCTCLRPRSLSAASRPCGRTSPAACSCAVECASRRRRPRKASAVSAAKHRTWLNTRRLTLKRSHQHSHALCERQSARSRVHLPIARSCSCGFGLRTAASRWPKQRRLTVD